MWVSYGKPCPIPIPCTAHSSAIDHTIPFPHLVHVWSISNGLVRYTAISKNVVGENDECQLSNGDSRTEKKMWVLNINRK